MEANEVLNCKNNFKEKDGEMSLHPFYQQIIRTWQKFHNFIPTEEGNIREETLWNNVHITVGSKTLDSSNSKWKAWLQAGTHTIQDLCHQTETRILGQKEINEKFGLAVNYLDALTIRNCIPHGWRKQLSGNFSQQITPRTTFKISDSIFDIAKTQTKSWYDALLQDGRITIKRQSSREQELNLENTTQLELQERYSAPYKVSRETKLQSFAFKLAHRLIPCGHYLQKMKIQEYTLAAMSGTLFFTFCMNAMRSNSFGEKS